MKQQVVRVMMDLWSCYNHEEEVFWTRTLRAWEIEELKYLDEIISSIKLNSQDDSLLWIPSGKQFTTKDGLQLWRSSEPINEWSGKFIWKMLLPPNVKLFLWKVHLKILPTKSLLRRRIGSQFKDSHCLICNHPEETQDHILWKCISIRKLWQQILTWWGFLGKAYIEDANSM